MFKLHIKFYMKPYSSKINATLICLLKQHSLKRSDFSECIWCSSHERTVASNSEQNFLTEGYLYKIVLITHCYAMDEKPHRSNITMRKLLVSFTPAQVFKLHFQNLKYIVFYVYDFMLD